jgi:hypothetical protein
MKKIVTVEMSDRLEFDKSINIMIDQGWEIVNSHTIPEKYSMSLIYNYNENEEDVEFYENHFVKKRRMETGECKEYFKNGNIKLIRNYNKESSRHGHWVEYYENGTIKVSTNFLNDEMVDQVEINSENGNHILYGSTSTWTVDDHLINRIEFWTNDGKEYRGKLCFNNFEKDQYLSYSEIIDNLFISLLKEYKLEKDEDSKIIDRDDPIKIVFFDRGSYNSKYYENEIISRQPSKNGSYEYNFPLLYCEMTYSDHVKEYSLKISSFNSDRILCSTSKFKIIILHEMDSVDEDSLMYRLIPVKIRIGISDFIFTEYVNIELDNKYDYQKENLDNESIILGYRFRKSVKGNKEKYFNISGKLNFFHNREKVLSINNLFLNNPHYNGYTLGNKMIDWYIYNNDSPYQRGSYEMKQIHETENMELERSKGLLLFMVGGFYSEENEKLNSNETILKLYNKEDNEIFKMSFFRDRNGLSRDDVINLLCIEKLCDIFYSQEGSFLSLLTMIINPSYMESIMRVIYNIKYDNEIDLLDLDINELLDSNDQINILIKYRNTK